MRKLALLAALMLGGVSVPAAGLPVIDFAPDNATIHRDEQSLDPGSETDLVSELRLGSVIIPLGKAGKGDRRSLGNFRIPAGIYTFRWQSPPPQGKTRIVRELVPLGAVPEPQTWALAVVGIGLAGSMLRMRRRLARPSLLFEA